MRLHATCAYKGTNYSGWQKQVNEPTVQEEIEKVISRILNVETSIQGSGRTDALVHANEQHFHFEVNDEKKIDIERFMYSINCLLPRDIAITSLEKVDESFHSRFSAKEKVYIYKISRKAKDPFKEDLYWLNPNPFDYELLVKSLSLFEGEHDFRCFTSKEEDEDNYVRNISKILVKEDNEDVIISFTGNGFMRYQIRFMVGTAVAVASKDEDISYIKNHLDSGVNREIVRYKAPGQGLYLDKVIY